MRVPRYADRGSVAFNMTPMIDVTFLLIVFFLVSSHMAQQEVDIELDLPAAASGQQTPEETRRLVINVLAEGRLLIAGEAVPPDELDRLIEFEHGKADRDLEVRIRSDRDVPYRFVEPILLAAARAGVWKVTFAVVRGES